MRYLRHKKVKGTCSHWRCWGRLEAALLQSHHVIQKSETNMTQLFQLFLWQLKKSTKETPKLTWSVFLKVVSVYSNISKQCLLCLNEKLLIPTYPDQKQLLNKRNDKRFSNRGYSFIIFLSVIDSKYIEITGLQDFYKASSFTGPFKKQPPEAFCKKRCF